MWAVPKQRVMLGMTAFVCFCLWHPFSSPSVCGVAIFVSVLVLAGRFCTVSFDTQEVCTHTRCCVCGDEVHRYVGVSTAIQLGYVLERDRLSELWATGESHPSFLPGAETLFHTSIWLSLSALHMLCLFSTFKLTIFPICNFFKLHILL